MSLRPTSWPSFSTTLTLFLPSSSLLKAHEDGRSDLRASGHSADHAPTDADPGQMMMLHDHHRPGWRADRPEKRTHCCRGYDRHMGTCSPSLPSSFHDKGSGAVSASPSPCRDDTTLHTLLRSPHSLRTSHRALRTTHSRAAGLAGWRCSSRLPLSALLVHRTGAPCVALPGLPRAPIKTSPHSVALWQVELVARLS